MKLQEGIVSKYLYITYVITSYWIVSILTVFVNKALLSSEIVNLDAPLFVTWFQCIVSVIISVILRKLSQCFPKYNLVTSGTPFSIDTFKKVLPLSILFAGMIATNNLCLKYVDVAFYYIGRSLTTIFNVVFTYILLGEKTSFKCVICCAVIVGGFWLGVDQEQVAGSLSVLGTFFGVTGSLLVALYSIRMKQTLPDVDQDVFLLSYCNNMYSVVLFIPLMLINDEHTAIFNYEKLWQPFFWCAMTTGGLFGFAIGYFTALQVKVTSPLTHNISGTAKACVQTVLATYWFNETKTFLWWVSNIIVLGASAYYARVRQLKLSKEYKLVQQLKV
ncbi:GDP-fucose transporter 1 [Odontomachus brunneus]|uniref:GDP-fucose transporter 1 n=1 Tax=Odontomachus brunneus TaxID=486640 RepID=UPI0013F1D26D|nr:GDP-fucose transporter 1 [Odontomachus brunneus]XP_032662606.1 GDP-fucose transporter 1 [Odontomachus brunneus]XP_032662607.1 GDP-fucose transporter 1 [Odontomachus brunneus]XP_032662608.1 GDP-fucose transporter 1 [Odontomachus brunneus]XP_032662609.1 GDP-fucose transporter 1 [Odontomachus brunneus]XP_032662610.1 GDP-fucose transporter 1 [Odontomachus brunneus]XP_032662612.1 GDP-fucose transporter 1 [Odontomachus brunneus]XP_032662613.1 GDP-fucose transporter 1 [Odontomachus brunneus]XP_